MIVIFCSSRYSIYMADISFLAVPIIVNDWLIIKIPKEQSSLLPSRGQVMVEAQIGGVVQTVPLEPDGMGGHWLHVSDALKSDAKVLPGKSVTVAMRPIKDWPDPELPEDFAAAIKADPQVASVWASITPVARWEWIRWIISTPNPATRARRIEVAGSKMRHGSRRPCCFNRSMCCIPEVSKNGVLLEPAQAGAAV